MALLLLGDTSKVTFSKMVKARLFFGILLLLISASVQGGIYQRTRHGHALVWNDHPNSFQEATWSGGKDGAGYATGYGTLTWYAPATPPVTGSTIPSRRKMVVVGTESGTMEHGKFVNPPKTRNPKPPARTQRQERSPTPAPASDHPEKKEQSPTPAKESSPSPSPTSTPAPTATPPASNPTATPQDESINSLTRPPSSLQLSSPADTLASPHPSESASPSPEL